MVQSERYLALQVAKFLQLKYPSAIYRFDLAADIKLTLGQASRHKVLHPLRGYPDLGIFCPRGGYHGLFLELKADGTKLYKVKKRRPDGSLAYASPHLEEQAAFLASLRELGYKAHFAIGLEEAIRIIDSYFALPIDIFAQT